MNVNQLILEAAEAIGYPAEQDLYTGTSEKNITFTYEDERAALYADNLQQGTTVYLMVSLNTPKNYNYFRDKDAFKNELLKRGFFVEGIQSWLENEKTGTQRVRRTVYTVNITGED